MATALNTSFVQVTFKTLGAGLNSTAGALNVADEESSDLLNIDFNKFGSVLKRQGYTVLNTTPLSGASQGLHWYQGLFGEYAVTVNKGKIYKMDNLDGTWDEISGAVNLGGVQDSYTKLMLDMEGANGLQTFTDISLVPKTVTNIETYDNYTVLMLHFDDADGIQTFTDASVSAHAMVSISSTAISTTQSRFGGSSVYFDGAGKHLTSADSADWYFSTSDFTIDFQLYFTDNTIDSTIIGQSVPASTTDFWRFGILSAGRQISLISSGTTIINTNVGYEAFENNKWYHVAITRLGNVFNVYKDGVSLVSATNALFFPDYAGELAIGGLYFGGAFIQNMKGYVDEIRISKGVARWINTFVPYSAPYGRVGIITSLKALGNSSAEFKDSTRLTLTSSTDWFFTTTDFTIDFWSYFYTTTNSNIFVGQYADASNFWYVKKESSSGANANKLSMRFVIGNSTKSDYTMTTTWNCLTNQFYHFAFIRSATVGTIYIDGTSQTLSSTTAFGTNDVGYISSSNLTIGQQNSGSLLNGVMDNIRVSKGIARWTSNFTPPTESYGGFLDQDFETFLGYTLGTDSDQIPWSWAAQNATASNLTVPTGLTGAKYIKKFQNYCFLANVKIAGIRYPSRVYWSAFQNFNSWNDAEYIDISKDDGQEITGVKELGDRLVIYKNNSIYVIVFTGDADIPFIVQRTNSAMGTVSHRSIQANENGHIFSTYDGIAFFDGYNSYKVSDRINDTYSGINHDNMDSMVSLYQKEKNRYWLSCRSGTSLYNNFVITWDSYLNALSVYSGLSATSLCTFLVNQTQERPYFGDSLGYYYRGDYGNNDYPTNTKTAISSYFYTNWKSYDNLCDQKGTPNVYLTHRNESSTILTFNYAYDFYNGNQYTQSFSAVSTQSVTGLTTRQDLNGRGRFVRIGISNNQTDTSFRIDGIGTYVTKEGKS